MTKTLEKFEAYCNTQAELPPWKKEADINFYSKKNRYYLNNLSTMGAYIGEAWFDVETGLIWAQLKKNNSWYYEKEFEGESRLDHRVIIFDLNTRKDFFELHSGKKYGEESVHAVDESIKAAVDWIVSIIGEEIEMKEEEETTLEINEETLKKAAEIATETYRDDLKAELIERGMDEEKAAAKVKEAEPALMTDFLDVYEIREKWEEETGSFKQDFTVEDLAELLLYKKLHSTAGYNPYTWWDYEEGVPEAILDDADTLMNEKEENI